MGSTFPLPKTEIKTLIHAEISKHFVDVDVNHLLTLTFSEAEGGVEDIRDDTGKKYELNNNINDYQKEVHKKTHDKNKDIIIAVATELNKIMIALAKAPWKEVADTSDDAIINGKIMKFLGRDGIETANA